jgi:hypothetical protein
VRRADRHVDADQRADADKREFPQTVTFNTAAAPPPEAVLSGMADAGFAVTHLYGLTETYGPAVVNEWHSDWDALDKAARTARRRAGRALRLAGRPDGHGPRDDGRNARRRRDASARSCSAATSS